MAKIRKFSVKHESASINGISLGTAISTVDTSNVLGLNLDNCSIALEVSIVATETGLENSAYIKRSAVFTKKNGVIVSAIQNVENILATSGILNFLSSSIINSGNLLIVNLANVNLLSNFTIDSFVDLYVGSFGAPFTDNTVIFP